MNKKTKISILLPVYKAEPEYLKELFQSIQQQEYSNYEIVISDDGEDEIMVRDAVPEKLLSKIKYVKNQSNRGIFSNINNAIKNSEGDFLQLFCQDDVMLPKLLGTNLKALEDHPEAAMAFTLARFKVGANKIEDYDWSSILHIPSILTPETASNYLLYYGCLPGNLSNVMLRRSVFDTVGLFNVEYKFAADYDYWSRVAKAASILIIKEPHVLIRNHKESASIQLGPLQRYQEIKEVYNFLLRSHSLPFNQNILEHHIHRNVLRSVISYFIRKRFRIDSLDIRYLSNIFNNKPYSWRQAFISFLSPVTKSSRRLQQYMQKLNQDWEVLNRENQLL